MLSFLLSIGFNGMQAICRHRVWILALCCTLTGCAQSQYHASSLPAKYVARPARDYSTLDLTTYSHPIVNEAAILPGDHLEVNLNTGTFTEDAENVWKVSVDSEGEAWIPNIGRVQLAGLTKSEAEKSIVQTSLARDVFLTPAVSVSVANRRNRRILVTGAVATPGPITVFEDSISLADAIVRAGGLTKDASGDISVSAATSSVTGSISPVSDNTLHAVGQKSFQALTVSLENSSPGDLGQTLVPEGAVIHVEKVAPRPIQVSGVIRNQVVEIPSGRNYRLLDAITLAGGQTYSNWISDKIRITRRDPASGKTFSIQASIRKARNDSRENLLLAPNDIVNVEENIMTFTLSTLSGFIGAGANAARFGI